MMFSNNVVVVFFLFFSLAATNPPEKPCQVAVQIESGWICGARRYAENGMEYSSFQGIPYAKQPLGSRRFKDLEPVDPWDTMLDTTELGPICPQHDELFSRLMAPTRGMSESCIYGNVYVPTDALPYPKNSFQSYGTQKNGRRILVVLHGGAFHSGSGDTDIYGPEYLVSEGIIIITFNYRINVFGFLSLNSPQIPGNAGLRDTLAFLRWVKRNARSFGGDPDDVTLLGHSTGATNAHLLSMSDAAKGLFKRLILISGTANPGYYSASPLFAKVAATLLLNQLGINSTNPAFIHDQLINTPLEAILKANSEVQYKTGFVSFTPVIETAFPGVERIIDLEPNDLVKLGRGKEYPMLLQYSKDECEFFRRRLEYYEITKRIEELPPLLLSPRMVFNTLPPVTFALALRTMKRYFSGRPTMDEYMHNCVDVLLMYPMFKLAQWRSAMKAAPVYFSTLTYESQAEIIKKALHLNYTGTTHSEQLTYLFRANSFMGENERLPPGDDLMKEWLKSFVVNFMECSNPTCIPDVDSPWPALDTRMQNYQWFEKPAEFTKSGPTKEQIETIKYFDELEVIASKAPLVPGTPESALFVTTMVAAFETIKRPPYILYESVKNTNKLQGKDYII